MALRECETRDRPTSEGHQDSLAPLLAVSEAYHDAIQALHKLGRTLETLSANYAQAAKLDASALELKREALRSMLDAFGRDERAHADALSRRKTTNIRQLQKAAND